MTNAAINTDIVPARCRHHFEDGRIQCDVCSRSCKVKNR